MIDTPSHHSSPSNAANNNPTGNGSSSCKVLTTTRIRVQNMCCGMEADLIRQLLDGKPGIHTIQVVSSSSSSSNSGCSSSRSSSSRRRRRKRRRRRSKG